MRIESMVWRDGEDVWINVYDTWEEAEKGFNAVDGIGMDSLRRRPLWRRHAKRHPDGAPGALLHLGNLGYAIIDIAEDS